MRICMLIPKLSPVIQPHVCDGQRLIFRKIQPYSRIYHHRHSFLIAPEPFLFTERSSLKIHYVSDKLSVIRFDIDLPKEFVIAPVKWPYYYFMTRFWVRLLQRRGLLASKTVIQKEIVYLEKKAFAKQQIKLKGAQKLDNVKDRFKK